MVVMGSRGTTAQYEILELLERGEAGFVYKARDTRSGSLVALDLFSFGLSPEEECALRRVTDAVSGIGHPHLSEIKEVGELNGRLFVARPLQDGETLRARIDGRPLSPEQAVGLASQVAAALGRAHEQGIVHEDVRPANILVNAKGEAKVGGFGLSRAVDLSDPTSASIAVYRSPEQLRGEAVDARTDVWSLGVVLYEMIAGRLPFRGRTRQEVIESVLGQTPEPLSEAHPGISPDLEALVARCLAKSPEGRPAAMDELLLGLRQILAGGLSEVEETAVEVPRTHSFPNGQGMDAAGDPLAQDGSLQDLPGRRLDHYRVLKLLGRGAVGTVYEAEDTRLRRTVALKLLPAELTRDPMAKALFLQEAQAASALDHANLCTVYEVGENEEGHLYLAMACYDGQTIKEKIARGPLPVAEAVDLARQVAHGLAKAHRHGIVHRDIKPANLAVTSDGIVKILDFGLAKLRGAAGLGMAGSFLGTPAYMSPEQARGEEVDSRTDVWSLGVVLFEMLAGARPFRPAKDLSGVLQSLLGERPRSLRHLRSDVPPELERIVERMLARSPSDRYPSAAEALADLTAFQESRSGTGPRSRRVPIWAAAFLAVVALAMALWLSRRPEPLLQGVVARLTDEEGREEYPSLSPDGTSFVYVKTNSGQRDLYLQRIGGGAPILLTASSPLDDTQPAFSPDGRTIAFRSEREGGGIYVAMANGGAVRRLTDFGFNPAWSPDGREIAVATEAVVDPMTRSLASRIWRVDVATGRRTLVVESDGVQPSWSPHGRRIAYWGLSPERTRRILWTVPAAGGAPVPALDDGYVNWNPVWSPDGSHLYFGSDRSGSLNLWRLPIDERSGRALGKPQPVTTPSQSSGFWSVSRDGRRVVYATNESKANLERFPFDPGRLEVKGAGVPITRGSHAIRSSDISPDGAWIAFQATSPQEDLYLVRSNGEDVRRLTEDRHKDRHPFWSPDGRRLLFYSNRGGSYQPWILHVEGRTLEPVLKESGEPVTFPIWAPDGKRVACTLGQRAAVIDLTQPLQSREPALLPSSGIAQEAFYPTSWSADGKWLAGNIARWDRSIPEGIGLFSFETRAYERLTSRGSNPIWLRDGSKLLYMQGESVLAFDTATREVRTVLAPRPPSLFTGISVSHDRRSLFAIRSVSEGDIWLLALQ